MTKTIAKTFRISPDLAHEIELQAEEKNVTLGEYLQFVFLENKKLKMQKNFEEDLAEMQQDTKYHKEQKDLANSDFL